jgi:hypothetical protein
MSRVSAARDAWRPQSKQDREAVLLELQQVLASPHFCNSKRYPALLQYIVEKTLAGEADHLKERTLGVEVFDRQASYDTNADTVVRYTAGEVRKRLSLYYHELASKPAIQISLPAGSYVPEFIHELDESDESGTFPGHLSRSVNHAHLEEFPAKPQEHGRSSPTILADDASLSFSRPGIRFGEPLQRGSAYAVSRHWPQALAALAAVLLLAGLGWRYHTVPAKSALEDFWGPALRDQRMVPICTGVVVFAQNNYSGVITAGKDADYPFVSMQSASAIGQLSALLDRSGATTQLESAATTPLTALREHPVILLGGYNNQWTMLFLQPLRFHFLPEPAEAIVDQTQAQVHWQRDHSQPYSSADDYAIVARFRDPTTDSWVIALAGLGRNGTEAATEFATSPHYMQLLRDRLGSDFSNRNIEAVLKIKVIDGKTGAPSILAVHQW